MTEGARPGKIAPRFDLDGLEWKAVIAVWLGAIYLVGWFSVQVPEPPTTAASEAVPMTTTPVKQASSRATKPASRAPARTVPDVTSGASGRRRYR